VMISADDLWKPIWRKVYWTWKRSQHARPTRVQRHLRRQMAKQDRDCPEFSENAAPIAAAVRAHAEAINGDRWNYYSGSLTPSNVSTYEQALEALMPAARPVSYLEIGSAGGISMALVGLLLKKRFDDVRLVSVDPYYASGYREGGRGPAERELHIEIDKTTKMRAQELYQRCALRVENIELPSTQALRELIRKAERFDLIYIDGLHEGLQPAIDFGLCVPLLSHRGILMLDDHIEWVDVTPIKILCDRHATKVAENLKIAAYRLT